MIFFLFRNSVQLLERARASISDPPLALLDTSRVIAIQLFYLIQLCTIASVSNGKLCVQSIVPSVYFSYQRIWSRQVASSDTGSARQPLELRVTVQYLSSPERNPSATNCSFGVDWKSRVAIERCVVRATRAHKMEHGSIRAVAPFACLKR